MYEVGGNMNATNQAETDLRDLPPMLLRGLDSLYVSYYFDTSNCVLDWDELAYQKERVGCDRVDDFAELTLGSETFALKPFGRKPYKYVLTNKVFEVRLSENLSPSCHVQYSSEGLWQFGCDHLTDRFDAWRNSVGFLQIRPEVVSRADWAFDYHLPEPGIQADHFVSRARKDGTWRDSGVVQTITIGHGDTVVRVYDKVAEIEQQSNKVWFHELWGRTDEVWRVEFQVRNARLKKGGIKTIADLKDFQADVLRETATTHTTLRCPNGDSNHSRWPLHPLWKAVRCDIDQLPQTGLVQNIDPKAPLEWREYRMGKSILGNLKGYATLLNLKTPEDGTPDLGKVFELLPRLIGPHHDETTWKHDIEKRVQGEKLGL